MGAGAGYYLFELGDEGGMMVGEGLVVVEEWLNQRLGEDRENHERQGEQPRAEPIATREAADYPVEEQQDGSADEHGQSNGFTQVGEPARPALDADGVGAADVVAIKVEGQIGQGDERKKNREEEKPLQPALAQSSFSPRFQGGSGACGEQQPEEDDVPNGAGD